MDELRYLKQLSFQYPTVTSAAAEIIKLSSRLSLPKGTEHFISDVHGEYDSFQHVLKSGSGSVAKKIEDEIGNALSVQDKKTLATLIYYPEEKLDLCEKVIDDFDEWCKRQLLLIINVARRMASKYNRDKFKSVIPKDYEYIAEELLTERTEVTDKEAYYKAIIEAITNTGNIKKYITVFSNLCQTLAVERLHVIGDIYDRGGGSCSVAESLINYHSVDIQWGNHDIQWMGAACGSEICIASVVRNCAKYGNLHTLEIDYGISLIELYKFAVKTYANDECKNFSSENDDGKLHKAITIILLKLEGQLAERRQEFGLQNRPLLHRINYDNNTINIDGRDIALTDVNLPTVDKNKPYVLSKEEKAVCKSLKEAFLSCEKLQRHIEFLYRRGSIYRVYNGNLLLHGCIPLDGNGDFIKLNIANKIVYGKSLLDEAEKWVRKARYGKTEAEIEYGKDFIFFLWAGSCSPLFGRNKMAVFESYFTEDSIARKEILNPYYSLIEDVRVVEKIFKEFGLNNKGHIINGHVPVRIKEGQTPVHCGGKVIIIDGGFAKAYQKVTGIAGYTLVSDSRCMKIIAHKPFVSREKAIKNEIDIHSITEVISHTNMRLTIADTDKGIEMQEKLNDLKKLIECYNSGQLREHAN